MDNAQCNQKLFLICSYCMMKYLAEKIFHHAVCQISLIPGTETHFKTAKDNPEVVCLPWFLNRLITKTYLRKMITKPTSTLFSRDKFKRA